MSEPAKFKLGLFRPHVGDAFRIKCESNECELRLIEATPYERDDSDETQNFSLVFHAPEASIEFHLPQQVYSCVHETLGTLELFLVPIGQGSDGVGIKYEAVFASAE